MVDRVFLTRSKNPKKKFTIFWFNKETQRYNKVDFGAANYEDYTIHKNIKRKNNYIRRHSGMNEDWGKSGRHTAGFWSRWLLWNKPNFSDAMEDIEKRFNIRINIL